MDVGYLEVKLSDIILNGGSFNVLRSPHNTHKSLGFIYGVSPMS